MILTETNVERVKLNLRALRWFSGTRDRLEGWKKKLGRGGADSSPDVGKGGYFCLMKLSGCITYHCEG
jgi:hypothetical protein